MAAGAGEDAYGSVSVRIAYFARAEVVGRVPASVFIPRPRVESVLVRLERLPAPAVDPALVSYERLDDGRAGRVRPSAQDAPALSGRRRRTRGVRAGRRPARRPGRGARRGRVGQAGGDVSPVLAPAKLTVTLRVTGVRADGYHELDAEMVTLSLADELVFDEGGSGLVVEAEAGARAERPAERRAEPRRPCARGVRAPRGGPPHEAHPSGRRARRRLGRRGGRIALGRVRRSRGGRAPRGRRALLPRRAVGPGWRGWGSASPRCPSRPASTCCWCRRSASTRRGSTGPGTRTPGTTAPNALAAAATDRRAAPGPLARRPGGPGGQRTGAGRQRVDLVRRGRAGGGGDDGAAHIADAGRHGPAGAGPHRTGGLGGGLRDRKRESVKPGTTCRPGAASGWPSASSCASSCASACGAS